MKKISLVLVVILVISVCIIGCTNGATEQQANDPEDQLSEKQQATDENALTTEEENMKAFNTVKKIEILDHSFANYGILYNAYINKLEKLFYKGKVPTLKPDSHIDLMYISSDIDTNNLTDDERKVLKDGNQKQVSINASNVFDDDTKDWKYIFTKATIFDPAKEVGEQYIYLYRRYRLVQQDGEYRILTLDQYKATEDTEEKDIQFNKHKNKIVEYVDTIPFVQ